MRNTNLFSEHTLMAQALRHLLLFVKDIHNKFIASKTFQDKKTLRFVKSNRKNVMNESGRYIAPKLRDMINSMIYYEWHTSCNLYGVRTTITVYKPHSYPNSNVYKILDLIAFIIYFCKTINPRYSSVLNITIILSPFNKVAGARELLTAFNVNSGFTSRRYQDEEATIIVYREEEVCKVLIHEMLHAFDIDCKATSNDYEENIVKTLARDNGININESFTDTYACLLNVIYSSLLLCKFVDKSVEEVFESLLMYEKRHILNIGSKVTAKLIRQKKENTHVTSYYTLKSLCWIRLEDFATYLKNHQYTIGSCKDFAEFLSGVLQSLHVNNDNVNKMLVDSWFLVDKSIQLQVTDSTLTKCMKIPQVNSIRMSSIDILMI